MPYVQGYSRQVVFITDGSVGNTHDVIQLVRANTASSRLFSLGVGSAASTELVDGVAAAGKGTADYATEEEPLDRKVVALLKRATATALYDVKLTAKSAGAAAQPYLQLPSSLPPAFADRRYYAYVLMATLPE